MKKYITLFSLLFWVSIAFAQNPAITPQNPFGLEIINSMDAYKEAIANNPNNELVDLKKFIPSIVLDVRYATKNNFMKQVMYKQARAFARKPVAESLKRIQAELAKHGYGIKVFDGYRPYTITRAFYDKASDKNFVANPAKGSKHNRGCAVDITLIYLDTKKELAMPTPYDSFEAAASPGYNNLAPEIIKNRDFLIDIMHKHGFRVINNEWWHFDFVGWQNYTLMDVPFEKL
ncbi:MAG: D-alanyl-D-alanine dipeptidase [Pedobacter sp.]|nr:MAG: D-alanyl-D-alanine dipeptidase [Pedobacter sp.]